MDVVRWQLVDVPIEELETEEALVDAVTAAVDGARSAAERSIVGRVTLTGRGPMHTSLARPGLRADVATAAQERLGTAEPFAWIEGLRDRTRPAVDVEARRQAEDFVGDLLRRLDAARDQLRQTAEGTEAPAARSRASRHCPTWRRPSTTSSATSEPARCWQPPDRTPRGSRPSWTRRRRSVVDRLGDEG